MMEWFKIGFGIGLGLIGAMLVLILVAGLLDLLDRTVRMARWKRKLKS
jgi:hypothetical protein